MTSLIILSSGDIINGAWNITEKDKTLFRSGSRLAILNINSNSSIDKKKAEFIYNLVAMEWKKTGIFSIIDPAIASDRLRSMNIDQEVFDKESIVQAGRAVYADFVLTGDCKYLFGKYILSVKLYEVATSNVILVVSMTNQDYKMLTLDIAGLIKGTDAGKIDEDKKNANLKINIKKGSTISVMPVNAIEVENSVSTIFTQIITDELFSSGTFKVIESSNLDKILNEYALRQSGVKKGTTEIELSSSSYLLFGTLAKFDGVFLLNIRVVSVATGEIEYSEKKEAHSISEIKNFIPEIVYDLSNKVSRT